MIPIDYKPLCPHPWKNNGGFSSHQILDADGKEVASVRYRKGFYNADAIAAVPELLEHLAKLVDPLEDRAAMVLIERVTGLKGGDALEAAGAYR